MSKKKCGACLLLYKTPHSFSNKGKHNQMLGKGAAEESQWKAWLGHFLIFILIDYLASGTQHCIQLHAC